MVARSLEKESYYILAEFIQPAGNLQVCFDSKEHFLWLPIIQHGGLPHNHA